MIDIKLNTRFTALWVNRKYVLQLESRYQEFTPIKTLYQNHKKLILTYRIKVRPRE